MDISIFLTFLVTSQLRLCELVLFALKGCVYVLWMPTSGKPRTFYIGWLKRGQKGHGGGKERI